MNTPHPFTPFFDDDFPLVVAYGGGVDSTALLVKFVEKGIRPDLILFADTKNESPNTYAYFPIIQEFLARHYLPPIQVVSIQRTSKHASLEEECLTNQTLPSLAFGWKSCSLKWKVGPQNKFVNNWEPAQRSWAMGGKVRKVIGYDASPRDACRGTFAGDGKGKALCACCRSFPCKKYVYWYPLMDWGIDRDAAKAIIANAGLPVPVKSSCTFCPAAKTWEIELLAREHPDLARRAVAMEENYRKGRHYREDGSTQGLGRGKRWSVILGMEEKK